MLKIGNVGLGSIPRVVLAVGDYSENLKQTCESGVSILEVRIDTFSKDNTDFVLAQLSQYKQLGLPLMATLRSKTERGNWAGSEKNRKNLLLKTLDFVDAVDIE